MSDDNKIIETFERFKEKGWMPGGNGALGLLCTITENSKKIYVTPNTTDKKIVVFPDLSTVVINDEQIYLWEWPHSSYVGEGVSGEIFPGVTLIGGTWFGIKRSEVPDINKIIVSFRGPNDGESYESLGPDFYFDIDLAEHIWEEIPEDLADEIR